MGIYESFVVLKHFGCDVSPKESSACFLFTIYILKCVFCKHNSVDMRLIDVYKFKWKHRETRIGNTFSKFTAIHRPWRKLHGGICRYKTFCMRVFARRTFLRFRYCSLHVKMNVLLTYSAVKRGVSMGSRNLVPAVSPMSGSPTFDTEKKENRKVERGEFISPSRPTARRSNY